MRKSKIVKILAKQHDFIEGPFVADEERQGMRSILSRLADKFDVRKDYNKAVAKRADNAEKRSSTPLVVGIAPFADAPTPALEKFNGVFDD